MKSKPEKSFKAVLRYTCRHCGGAFNEDVTEGSDLLTIKRDRLVQQHSCGFGVFGIADLESFHYDPLE